jgi:hypothetical protein
MCDAGTGPVGRAVALLPLTLGRSHPEMALRRFARKQSQLCPGVNSLARSHLYGSRWPAMKLLNGASAMRYHWYCA